MEKIKNVLSGHRKSESEDATHDLHTSSSTATGSEQHPIFDEMTDKKGGKEGTLTAAGGPYAQVQTTSGEPYIALAQPNTSIGHGHGHGHAQGHGKQEHVGTEGPVGTSSTTSGAPTGSSTNTTGGPLGTSNTTRDPIGSQSTTTGGQLRPDANPTGREGLHAGISDASIKSGVIGFGAGERQEHAALPTHNPTEQYMDRNQVVGGGDPGTAGMTEGQNLASNTSAQPLSHSGTTSHEQRGPNVGSTTTQQPYENTLRQQSYTADTDRSFPLAGGVASRQPHENTPPTQHTTVGEREPLTKDNEAGVHRGHGKEEVAGAAAAGTAGGLFARHHKDEKDEHTSPTQHKTVSEQTPEPKEKKTGIIGGLFSRNHKDEKDEQTSPTRHTTINEREPGIKGKEAGVHDDHDREKLAGAAAAGTAGGLYARHEHDKDKNEHTAPTQHKTVSEQDPNSKEKKGGILGGLFSRDHKDEKHTSPTQHETINERELGTKGKEAGRHDNHDREKLTGVAAGGVTSRQPHEHTSPTQHQTISEREPGTKEREVGAHESHGREGLAGAAALATAVGASKTLPRAEQRDVREQGLETRQATYGDVPSATTSNTTAGLTGSTTTDPTGSTAHRHSPEALAAATAAASKSSTLSPSAQEPGFRTQDRNLTDPSQTSNTTGPTSEPFTAGALSGERPQGTRSASHRHVPGEFPSPTPGDESKTFLDYHSVVEPTSVSGVPSGQHSAVGPTSTTDNSTSQHELRHTGSLEQPQSKSSDITGEHHYGRDAALVGGLGAGAAGLGTYAASQKHEASDVDSKPLYEESSPYSSKTLDPRVLGTKGSLEEPRSDPQAKSETLPHHAAQTSNPTGYSATSGPTASHGTKSEDPQHHYGRDAALVGAGAATAGGLHHTLQRNDTPSTGTAVLPQDSAYASEPLSTSTAPPQSSTTSAGSVPQQRSTGNDTFYGTSGAPAPVVDRSAQQQQPLSNLGHTSTSGTSAVPEKDPQHHYGRDAALAGGGAATAGGLYAASRDNKADTGPASKTIGPHDSNIANILDPRVQPDPSKQKDHTSTGPHKSDTLNRADPKVDEKTRQQGEHHYGRDAAAVGGTGAAGYGAYEAAKAYDEHRSTQPGASMNEQRYDTTATGATKSSPVPTQSQYNYNDPSTTSNVNRNAALGTGAGLGAAGAGAAAYAGSKHADNTQNLPLHQKQDFASSAAPGSVAQSAPAQGTFAPHNTYTQDPTGTQRHDPTQKEAEQHHDKRDAALLGTAGAAAAGGGAYAYSQHQEAERERARLEKEQHERLKKEAHDREKEQHRLGKEQHKHDKEASKLEKEQHKHEKEIAAAQHKHEKEVAAQEKEQHKHEKELAAQEKEQHKREKEADKEAHKQEKEHEGEEKKKGGLLGFLHRDKSKKEKSSPETSPRHSKEYAAAGTAGAVGAGTTAAAYDEEQDPNSPRWKGKNRLHKDPPPGHPAREALEQQQEGIQGGKREHVGVDGPIGDPNLVSGDRETQKGVYGGHDIHDTNQSNTVTEPNTGLPMNVGKYGAGTGGTDATPTIAGYHNEPGATGHSHTAGHQTAADTEAIRKADTPY
ncbi:Nn.00g007050.m01.CDS01 [Neocucurbitaria sp. VM-36]